MPPVPAEWQMPAKILKLRKDAKIGHGPKVVLSNNGFSQTAVSMSEGQVLRFVWNEGSNVQNKVVQVIRTDDELVVPVPGGYQSDGRSPYYDVILKLVGEYKFIGTGVKCVPLTVTVVPRPDYVMDLTDRGFSSSLTSVDEGSSIKFRWNGTSLPWTIAQVNFCPKHNGFYQVSIPPRPQTSGILKFAFDRAGVYYFQSHSSDPAKVFMSVVHVKEVGREYRVQIDDNSYKPPMMQVEQGDKIWFGWGGGRSVGQPIERDGPPSQNMHSICQIEPPAPGHDTESPYKTSRNGFKWGKATQKGLLTYTFNEPGVYYYCDPGNSGTPQPIGTVTVLPRPTDHFVTLRPDGFFPDFVEAKRGDRVWWTWSPSSNSKSFVLNESETCLSAAGSSDDCSGRCMLLTEHQIIQCCALGIQMVTVASVGMYHYKIPDDNNALSTCSVAVSHAPMNTVVTLSDCDIEPRTLKVYESDRVWFMWTDGETERGVTQVTYQGSPMKHGFSSGKKRLAPSAFSHEFAQAGVYYYVNSSAPNATGVIVVLPKPRLHEITVDTGGPALTGGVGSSWRKSQLRPDPLIVAENDVVYWKFDDLKSADVVKVTSVRDAERAQRSHASTAPRRCMNRVFLDEGLFHFTSRSFSKISQDTRLQAAYGGDVRLSSVIVEESSSSGTMARITAHGFEPRDITISRGQTVTWTWKENGEELHNVIHVHAPDSTTPLALVKGKGAFDSGQVLPESSYIHTFEDAGSFYVASMGAVGYVGVINVIASAERTGTPHIGMGSSIGGTVSYNHTLELVCDTADSDVYYTLDGATPAPWHPSATLYDPNVGVSMNHPGLTYLRAMAVKDGLLDSKTYTSRRFLIEEKQDGDTETEESSESADTVVGRETGPSETDIPIGSEASTSDSESSGSGSETETGESRSGASSESGIDSDSESSNTSGQDYVDASELSEWKLCAPKLKGNFINKEPGSINVVWKFADGADPGRKIRGYRLYLNGVQYCNMFPAKYDHVNVEGLAGGRNYEIKLECYPKKSHLPLLWSNEMVMRCPEIAPSRGPLISLERTTANDQLSIVWRNIASSHLPLEGYFVYVNSQRCGAAVRPNPDSEKCRAVVDECEMGRELDVQVAAVPSDGSAHLMSNVYAVVLPLDVSAVQLPPPDIRRNNAAVYQEYLDVNDGDQDVESVLGDMTSEEPKRAKKHHGKRGKPPTRSTSIDNENVDTPRSPHSGRRASIPASAYPSTPNSQFNYYSTVSDAEGNTTHETTSRRADHGAIVEETESGDETGRSSPQAAAHKSQVDRSKSSGYHTGKTTTTGQGERSQGHSVSQRRSPEESPVREDRRDTSPQRLRSPQRSAPGSPAKVVPSSPANVINVQDLSIPLQSGTSGKTVAVEDTVYSPEHAAVPYSVLDHDTRDGGLVDSRQYLPETPVHKGSVPAGKPQRSPQHAKVSIHAHDYNLPQMKSEREARSAVVEVDQHADITYDESDENNEQIQPVEAAGGAEPTQPRPIIELPIPVLNIEHQKTGGELFVWELPSKPDSAYKLTSYSVNVIGDKFAHDTKSDISFERLVETSTGKKSCVQHVWNVMDDYRCLIKGLEKGCSYRTYVSANWMFYAGKTPREVQSKSKELEYTTIGAPLPPALKVKSTDLCQVMVDWQASVCHSNIDVTGYAVLINGKRVSDVLSPETLHATISQLMPGSTIRVSVVATTNHRVGDSQPSRTIVVSCPARPNAPLVTEQPSYRRGVAVIGWDAPPAKSQVAAGHPASVTHYWAYVDGKWHGEIKSNEKSDRNGYQYYLPDLEAGATYEVSIRALCGQKRPDPGQDHVYCICESDLSNTIPVTCAAPPTSPNIYVEGMSIDGVDVTWEMPQQYGEAALSGFQLLKNGALYGTTLPPDVSLMRVKDIKLGEELTLQVVALTEHPIGGSSDERVPAAVTAEGAKYSNCQPGPKFSLNYTGLVQNPHKVWCERATGHTALVRWSRKNEQPKRAHFVAPDSYQVTWWPAQAEDKVNSASTTDDHMTLDDLRPDTPYTIVVEARRVQNYVFSDEAYAGQSSKRCFIVSAKSMQLHVRTGQPPEPASNLGVLASTCHSLLIGWDPPREKGVEVKAIRVDCLPSFTTKSQHICHTLLPDVKKVLLEGLSEGTDYSVWVTAVTHEYFEQLPDDHEWKKSRVIPKAVDLPKSDWLPITMMRTKTSGTTAAKDLVAEKVTDNSAVVSWSPANVYGNNRMKGYVVRWTKVNTKDTDDEFSDFISLHKGETKTSIKRLVPGFQYRVVVEAVVSVRTTPEPLDGDEERDRRTTHVLSEALFVRARAPVTVPTPHVTSFSTRSAMLKWERPTLCSVVARETGGAPVYVKRYLEGYKLYVNGKLHATLDPTADSCSLVRCKPGKTYHVILVALTVSHGAKRDKKRGLLKKDDQDESPSPPIDIQLPTIGKGNIDSIAATYVDHAPPSSPSHSKTTKPSIGAIEVRWTPQTSADNVSQWTVVWYTMGEGVMHKKTLEAHRHFCVIKAEDYRSIYEIGVEPMFTDSTIPTSPPQRLQVAIPGPPDAPEIFLHSCQDREFAIEWGEPACHGGARVTSYQLYMNDKKIGGPLSPAHRKALIPCKPNRQYKVYMFAASGRYGDSTRSNTLVITTPGSRSGTGQMLDSGLVDYEDWEPSDQTDLRISASQVTDTSMKIDWDYANKPVNVKSYKMIWSCSTQPKEREVPLTKKESTAELVKLFPGTTHFIKMYAIGEGGHIVEKSKQLIVQTCAPPDTPVLGIRACNFRYIAIEWEKPKTYGEAYIVGYKVFVNGVVEAVNGADQLSYNFTTGKFSEEYSFQVQAMSSVQGLLSRPSNPLLVTWPGVRPPVVKQIPTETNSTIKVGWDRPYTTEGVKIKHYKLVCREEGSGKVVQSVSPIHPDTVEAELHNLRRGLYTITLEIHLHSTTEVFRTDPITTRPLIFPDPPRITVTVVGLEERRQLDKVVCDLINKRYRLISVISNMAEAPDLLRGGKIKKADLPHAVARAQDYLVNVDQMLMDCFAALSNFTGSVTAHISWTCPQSSPDVSVSGYRVLIDGKKYSTDLHSNANHIRIKLNLDSTSHRITMVALSDRPHGVSHESNAVEVLTEPFRPFTNFCYSSIHKQGQGWPKQGCCRYDTSMNFEKQQTSLAKVMNKGRLTRHVPPPSVNVLDIFECDFKTLIPNGGPSKPTALLFWTPWCSASLKTMDHFFKYSLTNSYRYDFVGMACGVDVSDAASRQDILHFISSHAWRSDATIRQCSDQSFSSVAAAQNFIKQNLLGLEVRKTYGEEQKAAYNKVAFGNTSDLLGIGGVPTIVVIHPNDSIVWMGTYSAYDYDSFSEFLTHTISSNTSNQPCPNRACSLCMAEAELFGVLTSKQKHKEYAEMSAPTSKQRKSATVVIPTPSSNRRDISGTADKPTNGSQTSLRHRRTQSAASSRPNSRNSATAPTPPKQNGTSHHGDRKSSNGTPKRSPARERTQSGTTSPMQSGTTSPLPVKSRRQRPRSADVRKKRPKTGKRVNVSQGVETASPTTLRSMTPTTPTTSTPTTPVTTIPTQ